MSELHVALTQAAAGQGRLVLITGEAGMGKTRLVEEFAQVAGQVGAGVLWGQCWEGENTPTFWPWVQILRAYVQQTDPEILLTELGSGAADLAPVVDTIREQLPGLPLPSADDPDAARFRFFDGVRAALTSAGRRRPLVLFLEDLHWADLSSLRLLHFLTRQLGDTRLLMIGTYREEEIHPSHPLGAVLGKLASRSHRIVLRGLSVDEVAHFISGTSSTVPSPPLVSALCDQTGGNPFFVSELVRALAADGRLHAATTEANLTGLFPQSVRAAIHGRLASLSPLCQRLLTLASVLGGEFDIELLMAVGKHALQKPPAQLLTLLDEALHARVLTGAHGTGGRYRFVHSLLRETLYGDLPVGERLRLHRQIGEALETRPAADLTQHLSALATHFCQAAPGGEKAKAIEYTRQAAEHALAMFASEDAVAHYRQAVHLTGDCPLLHCQLLLALGDAVGRAGDHPGARETFAEAARVAHGVGNAELLARAALGFSAVREETGELDHILVDLLEAALTALGPTASSLRVKVLAWLAVALAFSRAAEYRDALSREALEVGRALGDPRALTVALMARCFILWGPGTSDERLALTQEMLQLAEASGNRRGTVEAQGQHILCLLEGGDIDAADRVLEHYARQAAAVRRPVLRWHVVVIRAGRALLAGRFAEAEQLATEAVAIRDEAGTLSNALQFFTVQLGMLRREQGRLAEWAPALTSMTTQFGTQPIWRCGLTLVHCELGNREEARREFELLAVREFADLPRDANWLPALTLLTEVCCFLGDVRRAATLATLLQPYAENTVVVGLAVVCYGAVARSLGLLATLRSECEEAEAYFETALQRNRHLGALPLVAHTQHD